MRGRRRPVTVLLTVALLGVSLLALAAGSVTLSPLEILGSVGARMGLPAGASLSPTGETILFTLRLPRVLLAALVGGGLAVVGAVLQSLFRNPIADSSLLGVGSGAALGAVLAVKLGWTESVFLALPLAAFAGAALAVLAVYLLAHGTGRPTLQGLLLTGLSISALASAGTSILLVATEEYRVKVVLFWLAGGLDGRSWSHVTLAAGCILPAVGVLWLGARLLDVLSLGDDEAQSLGLFVHPVRLGLLALAALITGAATAVAGSVPFVGLIAPHALRPMVGPLGRRLLPVVFLGGAVLVVAADLVARSVGQTYDLPLGSLTAVVGAPYFLLALRGNEGRT